ncbi:hypothetical protein GWN42_05700 [candidate division KSB1 bacterium]|nr:hypothetical protein [candidate division KSB1 bacterium]
MSPFILAISVSVVALQGYGFPEEVSEKIEKTLTFSDPSGRKEIVVDNVNGSIDVTGYEGQDVKLLVHKTIFARSPSRIERAQEEVRLDIAERDNVIDLYVDGPFRRRDGSINHRGWRHYGYEVQFDFEIKVPQETNIYLKTVNDGEIRVKNVQGDYDLDNINGGIEFLEAMGSGRVYALNSDVTVTFDRNPESDCYFGSLNGDVDVTFLPNLSADFRFKTFNGDVYTDFEVTYLPPRKATTRRKDGKFVYKSDRAFGARVGSGGPEIEFDAFNGDIHVIKR